MSNRPPQLSSRTTPILRHLDSLPALPSVVAQLVRLTADTNAAPKAAVELVQGDPAILSNVLKAARIYGKASRATHSADGRLTVDQAVRLLGMERLRDVALSTGVIQLFDNVPSDDGFSRGEFWIHSVAVACAAEHLAAQSGNADVQSAAAQVFCAGLLHDMGKLALRHILPNTYGKIVTAARQRRLPIGQLERHLIGLDHQAAGRRLCEQWGLDATITRVVTLHNYPLDTLSRLGLKTNATAPVMLVTLADQIARELHLGFSGNPTLSLGRESLLKALDLTDRHVDRTMEELVPLVQSRTDMMGLGKMNVAEIYRESIKRASAAVIEVDKHASTRRADDDLLTQVGKLHDELVGETSLKQVLDVVAGSAKRAMHDEQLLLAVKLPGGLDVLENGVIRTLPDATLPEPGESPDWAGDRKAVRIGGVAAILTVDSMTLPESLGEGWRTLLEITAEREMLRASRETSSAMALQVAADQPREVRSRTADAVAVLAAGAAHEFNNPLTVIQGRAQILASRLDDEQLRRAADLIAEQTERATEIVRDLLQYAEPVMHEASHIELGDLITAGVNRLRTKESIAEMLLATEPELALPDCRLTLTVDDQQVARAIAAVVENAVLATSEQGTIRIEATLDPTTGDLLVRIDDTGVGMDEATVERACDPFFSHQPAGRRRGLGLPLAARVLELTGGRLDLESQPGHGTTVTLRFPAVLVQEKPATPDLGPAETSVHPISSLAA